MPTSEVVAAYRETGSVWLAGRKVGLSGQSVWERLTAIGHPLRGAKWRDDEIALLREMAGEHSIAAIARQIGRPYGSVATKLSELGVSGRRKHSVKLPRGAGYDKATTTRRTKEVDRFGGSLSQYCRANGIRLDPFVKALQQHCPDWWRTYSRSHTDLPQEQCPYCGATFYPMTKKQKTCSRRCQANLRNDTQYFGGRRRAAIGLSEGVCQLCFEKKDRLAVHHMRGKENDPHNSDLIALCNGCHQLVGALAGRRFVESAEGWENLIGLVMLRRYGDRPSLAAVGTYVEVTLETLEGLVAQDPITDALFQGQLTISEPPSPP